MDIDFKTLLTLFGVLGGAALYFKKQSDRNKRDAITGNTEGQDKILKENQDAARRQVDAADTAITDLNKERDRLRKEYEAKTRAERAKGWDKKND